MKKMETNFENYPSKYAEMGKSGQQAESILYQAPRNAVQGFRVLVETITKEALHLDGYGNGGYDERQVDRIEMMRLHPDDYPVKVVQAMDRVRRVGNKASHDAKLDIDTEEALQVDQDTYIISDWFLGTYTQADEKDYIKPQNNTQNIEELKKQLDDQKLKIQQLQQVNNKNKISLTVEQKVERRKKSRQFAIQHPLNEAETREFIDQQLRDAGWEADTNKIRYSNTKPENGKNKAIAEWEFPNGDRADYALFIGKEAVGVVEAKKYEDDVYSSLDQAVDYSKEFVFTDKVAEPIRNYEVYKPYNVPFIFSTNGRPYLKQLEQKSGIWFWDARNPEHARRPLESWLTPDDLKLKLTAPLEKDSDQALKDDNDFPELANRDYQQDAIKAVENAIGEGKTRILLAMATGTGKTRTAISLMYRLIKNKRARRILYLVDRQSLATQTANSLKDNKVGSQPVSSIYDVKEFTDKIPAPTTRIQISTVQGMVQRLFNSIDNENKPSPGMYDIIIVDEAHRGYGEDREMSNDEMKFYDQADYISQYRRVIDYFDATAIGMTATPAIQTVRIFGDPVYSYSYQQAVIDGYLMDHNAPYIIKTKLSNEGIKFNKGQEVDSYNYDMDKHEKYRMPEDINFDVEAFNKKVITEPFNRAVCQELVNRLDPNEPSLGKTLIFAATDDHADMIVRLLKEEFEKSGNPVSDNAIMKITGKDRHRDIHIKQFKNEQYPNIVVTVDLLTTGIDVPSICNIVFLRRVKSRILYEQMLGRATRKFEGIDAFNIFDPIGQYDSMEKYTDMNSVINEKNVQRKVEEYYSLALKASTEDSLKEYRKQLVAKLQRKIQRLDDKQTDELKTAIQEKDLSAWARSLENATQNKLQAESRKIKTISEFRLKPRTALISNQKDEVVSVDRGYGNNNEKPADYLESFNRFIKSSRNEIPAIDILINRPSDLSLQDLRQIQSILSSHGFKENDLQSAWRTTNKINVAASIISFIRQAALGTPLESESAIVDRAMAKVYGMADWTTVQMKWLKRIEEQLKQNHILGPNASKAFNDIEVFKEHGGYKQMKRVFGNQTDEIISLINQNLYA